MGYFNNIVLRLLRLLFSTLESFSFPRILEHLNAFIYFWLSLLVFRCCIKTEK